MAARRAHCVTGDSSISLRLSRVIFYPTHLPRALLQPPHISTSLLSTAREAISNWQVSHSGVTEKRKRGEEWKKMSPGRGFGGF